jgi:hypothetical protein
MSSGVIDEQKPMIVSMQDGTRTREHRRTSHRGPHRYESNDRIVLSFRREKCSPLQRARDDVLQVLKLCSWGRSLVSPARNARVCPEHRRRVAKTDVIPRRSSKRPESGSESGLCSSHTQLSLTKVHIQ